MLLVWEVLVLLCVVVTGEVVLSVQEVLVLICVVVLGDVLLSVQEVWVLIFVVVIGDGNGEMMVAVVDNVMELDGI